MTADSHEFLRIRLEEVRGEILTLDGQLPDPITMRPAIKNIDETIELFERIDAEDAGDSAESERASRGIGADD
ncbi:hypothetical protein [Natrinema caseinilyticum]|uniref:hypothetical protein n=1 Tax=Natrinema caseinilyticum TaxID=2961570 RepID=UPI0020C23576|nr:hypothetical protein [Natrinema caseinilyticum]